MKHRVLSCVFLLATTVTALAQTLLVYVEDDTGDLVVRQGVYAAFFEAGYIFFDPGALRIDDVDWSTGVSPQLERAAIDGGADYLVLARASTVVTRREGERARVDMSMDLHVLGLARLSTRSLARDTIRTTNQGREDTVDRTVLGREVGTLAAAAVASALSRAP